ncbi:DsrE family protein [Xanthomarina sp. F1114]|uniref:DsrE family protein n=1 Tax=Xanthomarina sp. F1114 TaxID=2996019 RepID=UPI00225E64AC|nr:DsrE family protein [Xanthomarina sp. F1114]MCX7548934.1 DsrE family protein [Xanthomarina sp. F1114]
MRNHHLWVLLLFVGSIFYSPVAAQQKSISAVENSIKRDGKYAILVSNARYFQAAINTGKNLRTENPKIVFEVVLIGPVVKDLASNKDLESTIELGEKVGIRIVVCKAAMKHFGLSEKDYHKSIAFTPDGFVYLLGLQENNYKTITL